MEEELKEASAAEQVPQGTEQEQEQASPAWFKQMSRDEETAYGGKLKGFQRIGDLAKAYVDLAGREDGLKDAVVVPRDGATEEERRRYNEAVGIPTDGKYELTDDGSLYTADGKEVDSLRKAHDAMKAQVAELARESGLTKRQAQEVWNHQIAFIKAGAQAQAQQAENLRKTFSARTDNLYRKEYPNETERQEAVNADFAVVGRSLGEMPNLKAALQRSGVMLDPAVVRELAGYLRSIGAGRSAVGGGQGHAEAPRAEGGLTYSKEFYEHVRGLRNGN